MLLSPLNLLLNEFAVLGSFPLKCLFPSLPSFVVSVEIVVCFLPSIQSVIRPCPT